MALRTDIHIPKEPPRDEAEWDQLRELLWLLSQKQAKDNENLEEADTDQTAAIALNTAHRVATTGAHASTAISHVPTGEMVGTNVGAILDDMETRKAVRGLPIFSKVISDDVVIPDDNVLFCHDVEIESDIDVSLGQNSEMLVL